MKLHALPFILTASISAGFSLAQSTDTNPDSDAVVITASPLARSAYDLAQPVSILSDKELRLKLAPSLGETLRNEPGVAASSFTAGASRPIIRGLADNRVLVLSDGTDVFDVSSLSPDHAPSVMPLTTERIEIVRGAATVLYGSSAIGGVVNLFDNRIPTEMAPRPIQGSFDSRFGSANLERSGAASFDIRAGDHVMLHVDGSITRADSLHIPDRALSGRLRDGLSPEQSERGRSFGGDPEHIVPNTQVFTRDFGVGASYIWEKGYVGVAFNRFLSEYGVPDNPSVDDPVERPDRVTLDVDKRQYSLRAGIADPLPWLINGSFKATYTDYQHDEIDGRVVGSTFITRGFDSRLEFVHRPFGPLEGSFGFQALNRELKINGDESFLQPTKTLQLAAFVFEEWKLAPFRVQLGARVEYNRVKLDADEVDTVPLGALERKEREFVPLSFAAGLIHDFTENTNAALTVRYSERAPTAEELFARGPHDATFQFLVGDPTLGKERVLGVDLTLRKRTGVITGSIGGFYNRFFDFIEFSNSGEVEDDLDVFNYTDKSAEFFGGEAQVAWHFLPQNVTIPAERTDGKSVKEIVAGREIATTPNLHDLYLELRTDYVRAQDLTENQPLPRIPPLRYGAALVYDGPVFGGRIEVQRVENQDRASAFETETGGYTFVNASVSYTFSAGATNWDLYLRGNNLTDATARDHTSFLKEVIPLPGRSVTVGARVAF